MLDYPDVSMLVKLLYGLAVFYVYGLWLAVVLLSGGEVGRRESKWCRPVFIGAVIASVCLGVIIKCGQF